MNFDRVIQMEVGTFGWGEVGDIICSKCGRYWDAATLMQKPFPMPSANMSITPTTEDIRISCACGNGLIFCLQP